MTGRRPCHICKRPDAVAEREIEVKPRARRLAHGDDRLLRAPAHAL